MTLNKAKERYIRQNVKTHTSYKGNTKAEHTCIYVINGVRKADHTRHNYNGDTKAEHKYFDTKAEDTDRKIRYDRNAESTRNLLSLKNPLKNS